MKHSAVKQRIIETASTLFYEQGYNLTGINEIIKEAGIAKATLYNHFKSKDEICLAYLKHKNDAFIESLKAYIARAPSGKGRLLTLFDFLLQFYKEENFNGCWCINTVSEIPKEKEDIKAAIKHYKLQFMALIERAVEENLMLPSEVAIKMLARQIYVLYEGAIAESHLHQDAWPIESAKAICLKIIE